MGLSVSHNAWSGAYSAFTRWRHGLAKAAGYVVLPVVWNPEAEFPWMRGDNIPSILLDWGHVPPGALFGKWPDGPPADPLLIIFCHSDCEGKIKRKHCELLAHRLEELLPELAKWDDAPGHIGSWVAKTRAFIDGCRSAAKAGQSLRFG